MQSVDDWYVESAPEDVRVLAVMVDLRTENKAAQFRDAYGLSVDILADNEGEWLPVWGGNGGTDQHSYTVVDSEGRVSWHKEGNTNAGKIADKVDEAE